AVEVRQYQSNRRRGAGAGRDHVVGRRARAAQVLVEDVDEYLVVGVGVHRRHKAGDHADAIVNRLHQRREAIGGARAVRNHRIGSLQLVVVDADDDGAVDILLARRRDDHFLRSGHQMRGCLFLAGEQASAFQHHIHFEILPGQLGGVALRAHLDAVTVHHHSLALHGHRAGKFPVHRVVARQVRIGLRVAKIVDRDELQVVFFPAFVVGSQYVAADAAVTVDGDSNGHARLLQVFLYFNTLFTAFTTLSTVKPKYSNSFAPGADSP